MDHSTMNYEWKKITDLYIEGEAAKANDRVVEVVKFKDYGNTFVVYMYEGNKYKGARGYQGENLAKEMAIEYLETGKEL
jgi:hypothetical protein